MKKLSVLFIMILCLSLPFSGCQFFAPSSNVEKALYQQGLNTIAAVRDNASAEVHGSSLPAEIVPLVQIISYRGGEQPIFVYSITFSQSFFDENHMTDARFAQSLCGFLNNRFGTNALAASGSCTAVRSFSLSRGLSEAKYYLYVYPDSFPMFVSFLPGDGNSVLVNGCAIMGDNLDLSSASAVKSFFDLSASDLTVEQLSLSSD